MKISDARTFKTSASGKKNQNTTCCLHGYRETDEQCWHLFPWQLSGHRPMFKREPQENVSVNTQSTAWNITSCHVTPSMSYSLVFRLRNTYYKILKPREAVNHLRLVGFIWKPPQFFLYYYFCWLWKKNPQICLVLLSSSRWRRWLWVQMLRSCCLPSDQWCGYSEPRGGCGHPDQTGQRQLLSAAGSTWCGGELTCQTWSFWDFKQTSWVWTG